MRETFSSMNINYEISGAGPPVVAVHGWSMSGGVWQFQREWFSRRFRFVTMDLRGHGNSFAPENGYSIENFAADLVSLFNKLDLAGATIIGWSMGALVTLAAYPELRKRLSSMILVAGTPKFVSSQGYEHGLSAREPRGLSLRLKRNARLAMIDFFRTMFTAEELLDENFAQIEREIAMRVRQPSGSVALQSLEALVAADQRAVLAHIDVPVLLIHGDRDVICPPDASRYMAARIPGSTLEIIEGAGHAPMLSSQEEFRRKILKFLGKVYVID